ncbi:MAG TPA: cell division protein FtsA, partial [bacterium]|nr:cell division protein FtsA [bacterium]
MLEDYKTAIDIGSNKIVAVISEYDSVVKDLRICGYSEVESDGVRNGIVVNIDVLSNKIAKAIEEVEKMAGREVRNIIINASGKHINVIQSEGIHAVENQGYEITYNDICKVLETAKAVKMNPDSSILNIFPIEYKIDGQGGIIMPLNMVGVRLEVKVNIITGDNRAMHNLIKSINSLNLQVDDYIFSGIASANAVLTEEEKEHGVLLMDIGAGTIDVIGYENNSVFCVDSFDKGGEDVNIEIAKNFNTSLKEADRLKKEYGYALLNLCNADETIQINILGNAKKVIIKRCELVLVIENTLRKIFKEVLKK